MNIVKSLFSPLFQASVADPMNDRYWSDVGFGQKTTSGENVTPQKALTLSTYFACLRAVSEDVGKLPLKIYRRLDRGKNEDYSHPLYYLLHDQPNPEMSAMSFRETVTAHAMSWGMGLAEIVRNGAGEIEALYPIHPQRVTMRRDQQRRIFYEVKVDDITGINKPEYLRPEEVFHLHGLGGDGLTGYSVLRYASESLGLGLAAQSFGAAFFGNGASVAGVLEHPGKLTPEARTNLRESWIKRYGGSASKANQVAVLEEGTKFTRTSIPPNEAQFLETRNFQTTEVCRWFRIPPHKVQDLNRATFTNIESQNTEYVIDALMPWTVRWEQEIKRKLIGPADTMRFARHDFRYLMRGDSAARSNYYRTMLNVGALSPNDIRELEDQNPIKDAAGDLYYIQSNMTTLESAANGRNLATASAPASAAEETAPENDAFASHRPLFIEAADRVLRKEVMAVGKAAKRFEGNDGGLKKWLAEFYSEQESYINESFRSLLEAMKPDASAALPEFARQHANRSFDAALASRGIELHPDNTPEKLADAVLDLLRK